MKRDGEPITAVKPADVGVKVSMSAKEDNELLAKLMSSLTLDNDMNPRSSVAGMLQKWSDYGSYLLQSIMACVDHDKQLLLQAGQSETGLAPIVIACR